MHKELLEPYLNKEIRLVLEGNFKLNGVILKIDEPYISFRTKQKTSLIRFDRIMEVTPLKNGE